MLSGKTIITTGTASTNSNIEQALKKYNARIISFPLIKTSPTETAPIISLIVNKSTSFDWIIFTSKNGVKYFFEIKQFDRKNLPLIACIGEKTKMLLEKHNLVSDFTGSGKDSQTFIQEWISKYDISKKEILLVQGELADNKLLEGLAEQGCRVERINVYKTSFIESHNSEITQRILDDNFDYICFSSPSAFQSFQKLNFTINNEKIVCIGKTTANFIQSQGIMPGLVSERQNAEGLAETILRNEKNKIY